MVSPEDHHYCFAWHHQKKDTIGLVNKEELISSVKGEKDNISGGVTTSSAEDSKTSSPGEVNP